MLFSKHDVPSSVLFFSFLVLTCVCALTFGLSPQLGGLFLILWGVFGLLRSLWVLETIFLLEDADKQQRSMMLPWLLLSGMDLRARLDTGFRAMKANDTIMVLWFLLGALYIAWSVFVTSAPSLPDALQVVAAKISFFFEHEIVFDPDGGQWLAHIAAPVIAGLVFWLARTYALTLQNERPVVICAALLFGVCFISVLLANGFAEGPSVLQGSWKGSGFGLMSALIAAGVLEPLAYSPLFIRSVEMGMGGVVFLYMPAVLVALGLFKNAFHPAPKRLYALAGLGVAALLFWADKGIAASPHSLALFISGWGLVAVLYQFSLVSSRKAYVMRQL